MGNINKLIVFLVWVHKYFDWFYPSSNVSRSYIRIIFI
jgi:hypothetical protein